MKKALCILLACIIIIGGCSIQSTTPDAGEPAAMEEKETQETDESYPGHVPMGTVIACAEAWLEKEQGLTPFADIDKAELTWLDGSFIQQYKIDVIGKKRKTAM